ncbi:MAG: hypothetical protein M3044_03985 [Thermoproteota archaeon]|nr:hypothetical protein [Thermoproteota archaeon]
MKALDEWGMKILTKSFLETLNEQVNGDKDKCVESSEIFKDTELMGYESIIIPAVAQELACRNDNDIMCRHKPNFEDIINDELA